MIVPNPNSMCEQARPYYYECLRRDGEGKIPAEILAHIRQCRFCQAEVDRLEILLAEAEKHAVESTGQVSSAIITNLRLHFAYIGASMTCNTARPFLPSMGIPALEVGVPTPITVHLDKCRQCTSDLEAIRQLNLTHKQLCRLGQLLAKKPSEDTISCSQAQAGILAVVLMAFDKTNAEVLKHLCTCPDCREVLYQHRETVREELTEDQRVQKKFPCEAVSAADIFDYCFPYGIDPANDQYAKFRGSFTSHARSCPTCLSRMQQLHKTICNIAERPESEVVTIYTMDESTKAQAADESDDLYSGFPIKVEVITRKDEVEAEPSATTINFTAALKWKLSRMNLKPLVKTSVAAAAIILIAVVLFFNTLTAKAVTIERIYMAIEKVRNVYIATFVPQKKEPVQELWVSRTLNNYMIKTGKELVLWDLPHRIKKVKHFDSVLTETTPLSDDEIAKIEKKINTSFGLMPFPSVSEIPHDADWSRVTQGGSKTSGGSLEVYELTWIEEVYDGSVGFKKKWQVFVDPKANLPQRTEFYEKLSTDTEYTLKSVAMIEYLSDSDIQTVMRNSSF